MAPDRGSSLTKKESSRSWEALTPPLSPWILDAIASMNFTRMTPVQASTIPLFLTHKDVVVEAVTGSGKTLSFLVPVAERICRTEEPPKKHHVASVIISPTRELATQINNVLLSLLAFHGPSSSHIRSLKRKLADEDTQEEEDEDNQEKYPSDAPKVIPQLLLGGSSTAAQDLSKFLKTSPNVLIGTPGRLLEILSSLYVHCPQSSFEVLVLDEADRLLDLGFKDDLTKIISLLPKQRRTGLFSASVSEAVDQIIRVGLRNPVRIAVKVKGANGVQDKKTPASLKMTYLTTPASHKLPALAQILHKLDPTPLRTIVYLSTCAAVDYFQSLLPSLLPAGMQLVPLHGKHPANVREKNFIRFTNSASPAVLLTTDVAARGLDIPEVDLVVQIDPPSDPKVFLHRCGRAGRAGRKGLSIVLLHPGREEDYVSFLEIRKTPIEKFEYPPIAIETADAVATSRELQALVLKDRALHDKAQKAFVSWVRSYSKHQASSIFRVADLDWADLATGWALLRMPKMPELKTWDRSLFTPPQVDWDTYPYKDKQREKQRKVDLDAYKSSLLLLSSSSVSVEGNGNNATNTNANANAADMKRVENKKRGATQAWSEKVENKANKAVKRSKKDAKREFERKAKLTDVERDAEAETQRMVERIRTQQLAKVDKDADFEGFD